ncbi:MULTISPECIES: Lrp/AsnC family transcriptional regulator [Bacillales]|jgi:Lrp/AsnC family transcriptional regulator for asnA, asnC and gidA|uniref:Transcriptional regulator n=1 Tax=Brevibacillus aydinogluensis TaxID=927786 RepID=A0AA48MAF8_9BACL|nr:MULTISPECIES: Lrp/AsnC family transcriptional regulator [Bacillales]REK66958.1 MAG: transcriptional regulator [Brevibacillus sp.]MDT3416300.1 Lrp/AsnC family transcriptional regulator for asnA, asnC and gidA [Brevibacillus aydinogluensis]NNV04426.1 Lrp/AsnC family transcriptional regulator [Brevibacillus sp. MCWH]UFJ62629.1 Lrp/AsnC family transcriptional regulator [Anoxybacillus sediminis]CAJ1004251.1 Transcriptional regulator [Brevibacillus aydinogluensis]
MDEKYHRSLYSQLDDLDYAIARRLQDNARLPFTQIAKELGVTEKTVRIRVQQMQDEGVLSLVGIVNPVKAGITVQSLIQVAVEAGKLDDVVAKLQDIYEVRLVVLTTGDYQLMIQVLNRDYEELSQFLMNKLNKIEGITKVNVINELKVLKSRFRFIR